MIEDQDRSGNSRVFVIAEAGVNHNGSPAMAMEMINVAAQAGADAVKFQTFSTDRLTTAAAAKAAYQEINTGASGSQKDMLKSLELDAATHGELKAHCQRRGIEFMSTPFDMESVDLLAHTVGVRRLKVPSGEAINSPLLLHVWRTGLPIILSTGMCDLEEVLESLAVLAWGAANQQGSPRSRAEVNAIRVGEDWCAPLRGRVVVLHCVTQYPAAAEITNLHAMDLLRDQTGLDVGLSDHSLGWHIAIAAAARYACVIEKHFTLSRELPGPDHAASLEPEELARMVREIRDVAAALGRYEKMPQEIEIQNRQAARGSLVAARPISRGELFSADNLTIKRPGGGASPRLFWDYVGMRHAKRDYAPDELIEAEGDAHWEAKTRP